MECEWRNGNGSTKAGRRKEDSRSIKIEKAEKDKINYE